MKRGHRIALGLAAAIVVGFFLARTPDTNRVAMIEKYGGPNPTFAEGPGGMKVRWRDEGCRDCPVILLVHGSNASLHTWTPLIERLGAEHRLISYDQPGHGLTGPHPRDDYSAAGMFEALEAVAAAAGVEQFSIAGNSMGGWVAWRYALAHPDRVEGLILVDAAGAPAAEGAKRPPLNLGFQLARNPLTRPLLEHVTPRGVIRKSLLQTTAVDSIVTEEMVDLYWELLRFPGNRRATALRMRTNREPEFVERLNEITAPTLVLWGAEDALTPASGADFFAERIKGAQKVVLDGVGHIPMEEAPDATANAIRRFFEAQAPEVKDTMRIEPAR